MKQKKLINLLKYLIPVFIIPVFIFQSSAYTLIGEVHKVNNQLDYVNVNTGVPYASTTSYADRVGIWIDNSEPQLFKDEWHYTFDVVMGVDFGVRGTSQGSNSNLNVAIQDLLNNGYSSTWFAHYVWDFDGHIQYSDNSIHDLTTSEWTVYSDETLVIYSYPSNNWKYYGGGQLEFEDLSLPVNHLYVQIKVHFNFTVDGDCSAFVFHWNCYPFNNNYSPNDMKQQYQVYLDTSAIVSEDTSDLAIILSNMNIMNENILALGADIQDLQFQMTGLTSTLDELLDYIQQWNLLLFRNIPSNHQGIYYTFFEDLDIVIDELATIRSAVVTTRGYVLTIRNNTNTLVTTTDSINATSSLIRGLLDTRSGNFWTFLDSDFDLIHDDLIDLKDYLSQSVGDDVSTEQSTIDDGSASLVSITNSVSSPSASDISSATADFTISNNTATIFTTIYQWVNPIIGIFVIGAAVYFLLKNVWDRLLQ